MSSLAMLEPIYVLDTHPLIWSLTGDKKLGQQARLILDEAHEKGRPEIVLSVIVIAEMYWADKKHHLFEDFAQTVAAIKARPYVHIMPLDAAHILDFDRDSDIAEMHDRIIVGLARRFQAPLITRDTQIIGAGIVTTVW
jgi:PIN domain nuclease of toxin-antitoxin system